MQVIFKTYKMRRRDINEVYNILAKTSIVGLEGDKVTAMLVNTSKLRRIAEEGESLIKAFQDKMPKELKDLDELPKGEEERARLGFIQSKWKSQVQDAEQNIFDEEVEFDSHFLTQEETLAFLSKQSELKTTEKATLFEWLSK